jgi:hypothetical protein
VVPEVPQRGSVVRLLSVSLEPEPAVSAWSLLSSEDWPDSAEIMAVLETEKYERKTRLKQDQAAMWGEGGLTSTGLGMSSEFLPPGSDPSSGPVYTGHTACQACHPEAYATWSTSAHSQALVSLENAGENETVDCLQCHTTGLYERTGYDMFRPDEGVGAVTCESCHGPGSRHVDLMSQGGSPDDLAIERGSTDGCITCHDPYNSPHFKLPDYWDQISH